MESPKDCEYYSTNIGVLYFDDVWVKPVENNFWEPVEQDDVKSWQVISLPNESTKTDCSWVNKGGNGLQLQASLWWVASIKESELKTGLIYWKVVLYQNPISGYSDTKEAAIKTVEALIKSDTNYNYNVTNDAVVFITDK